MADKTLKQLADELGVDKQKIYRFVKKIDIPASSEVKQTKYYDETAQKLIKAQFNRITTSNERCGEAHQKAHQKTGESLILEQLIKELEVKNKQIKDQNDQLIAKDKQLENLQKLLDQEQQLHFATQQKLKLLEAPKENSEVKKKWWPLW